MTMRQAHLSDDRLIDLCFEGTPRTTEQQHLAACPACEERHARLSRLLAEVSDVASVEADAVFTDQRLARQRARILQRVEQAARLGRVLAFPGAHTSPLALRARPGMRWLAGAAAAGLVIGLVADHLAHRRPNPAGPASSAVTVVEPATDMLRLVSVPLSDDELLGRMEMAVEATTGGSALGPLDDLTPRVWEVAAQ